MILIKWIELLINTVSDSFPKWNIFRWFFLKNNGFTSKFSLPLPHHQHFLLLEQFPLHTYIQRSFQIDSFSFFFKELFPSHVHTDNQRFGFVVVAIYLELLYVPTCARAAGPNRKMRMKSGIKSCPTRTGNMKFDQWFRINQQVSDFLRRNWQFAEMWIWISNGWLLRWFELFLDGRLRIFQVYFTLVLTIGISNLSLWFWQTFIFSTHGTYWNLGKR